MQWDGISEIAIGEEVSWSNVASIVRWVDDNNVIIENSENGLCLKVPKSEVSAITDKTSTPIEKLKVILSNAPSNTDSLADYLVSQGVTITY